MEDTSTWHWFNFLIIVISLIMVIILYVLFYWHRRDTEATLNGLVYRIQHGKNSTADTMITGQPTLYLGDSDSKLSLTISRNDRNFIGRVIAIKNDSPNNKSITLHPGTGVVLNSGSVPSPTILLAGDYAILVAIPETVKSASGSVSNTFMRLQ